MKKKYATVNQPFQGKHKKPQDNISKIKRKLNDSIKPCYIWKGHYDPSGAHCKCEELQNSYLME